MRETKFSLGLPLAIAMSVILATSASVGSVLAAGNATAGGAAGNMTKAASNSSSSSNPLAKLGQALSGIFGGKK